METAFSFSGTPFVCLCKCYTYGEFSLYSLQLGSCKGRPHTILSIKISIGILAFHTGIYFSSFTALLLQTFFPRVGSGLIFTSSLTSLEMLHISEKVCKLEISIWKNKGSAHGSRWLIAKHKCCIKVTTKPINTQ